MDDSTPVLVVGGGLGGLAMAAFLAGHGVECLLIERRAQVAGGRARGTSSRNHRLNVRTMELLRSHELERAVREAGFHPDQIGDTLAFDVLAGGELARYAQPWVAVPPEISPVEPVCCEHLALLRALRERAVSLGGRVQSGTELAALECDADGVTATVRRVGTGAPAVAQAVRAAFVVGADGPASLVRELARIETEGPGTVARQSGVIFRADLDEVLGGRCFGAAQIENVNGILLKEPDPGTWTLVRGAPVGAPRPTIVPRSTWSVRPSGGRTSLSMSRERSPGRSLCGRPPGSGRDGFGWSATLPARCRPFRACSTATTPNAGGWRCWPWPTGWRGWASRPPRRTCLTGSPSNSAPSTAPPPFCRTRPTRSRVRPNEGRRGRVARGWGG